MAIAGGPESGEMRHATEEEEKGFRLRLHIAQAELVLGNIGLTLSANIAIAVTTALIMWMEGYATGIGFWLGMTLSVALLRFVINIAIKKSKLYLRHPQGVLRYMTVAALASGLSWAPIPISFVDISNRVAMGYVIFILAGMATGAIIQSLVYWPQAVAFGAPLVLSIVWVLLKSGGPVDYLIASNVFLLSVMLTRASILGEKGFRQSKGTALRALSLAESLTKANREIGRSHRALEQIANNDPLTGLSNRTVFNRQMEALDKAIADDGSQWALILLDIDKFKSIN
ncbi:MAG: hypothetical protein RLZZ444_3213, partial [Pseudomonadota bacterium]